MHNRERLFDLYESTGAWKSEMSVQRASLYRARFSSALKNRKFSWVNGKPGAKIVVRMFWEIRYGCVRSSPFGMNNLQLDI
jgi:hypothetical protein